MKRRPFNFVYEALPHCKEQEVQDGLNIVKAREKKFLPSYALVSLVWIEIQKSRQDARREAEGVKEADLPCKRAEAHQTPSWSQERAISNDASVLALRKKTADLVAAKIAAWPEHYAKFESEYVRELARSASVADYGYHPEYNK